MSQSNNNSRRDFLRQSAGLGAGAVLAGSRNLFSEKSSGYGKGPYPTEGMAGYSETGPLQFLKFQRRALGPKDVAIKIHYCGVCHSDVHTIHGDWGKIRYPQIVGHELAGEVVAIGNSVSKFDVGSRVGVGTMVDSCRHCPECLRGSENYFVLSVPNSIDLAEAGPLLCAGITAYSPLRHWSVAPGKKVAIAGLGGLGHLAVQFSTKMGADVTVVTTSPEKQEDAHGFGAKDVLINKDGADFSKYKGAFDFILDTIPYQHDLNRFIPLLKRDATLCRVGVGKLTTPNGYGQMTTVLTRTSLAGSNTGGIRETQDMLDFCAVQKIKPQITKIPMDGINDAWSKVIAKQARYRFVVDMDMRG